MSLRKSVPIKYHLNLHKYLPNYPTKNDLIFDLIDKLSKNDKLKFSISTINQIYKEKLEDESFKTKIKKYINELIEDKKIIQDGNFFILTEPLINSFIE